MNPHPKKALPSPVGLLQKSSSIAVGSVAKRCWSVQRALMLPLAWPHSMVTIAEGCPRLDARDVTARPWKTSIKSHSPPAGRYLERNAAAMEIASSTWGVVTLWDAAARVA
jgi:hypothetical protein